MKPVMHVIVAIGGVLCVASAAAAGAGASSGPSTKPGVRAVSSQSRVDESGAVTFTLAASTGESTLLAEGPGIRFEKRVTPERVTIRVEAAGDVLEFEADNRGAVKMGRRGKVRRLRMGARTAGPIQQAQELTAGF